MTMVSRGGPQSSAGADASSRRQISSKWWTRSVSAPGLSPAEASFRIQRSIHFRAVPLTSSTTTSSPHRTETSHCCPIMSTPLAARCTSADTGGVAASRIHMRRGGRCRTGPSSSSYPSWAGRTGATSRVRSPGGREDCSRFHARSSSRSTGGGRRSGEGSISSLLSLQQMSMRLFSRRRRTSAGGRTTEQRAGRRDGRRPRRGGST
mmetsp:Transcript_14184/g.31010  ORF Transcript_14184/g.31010 Transcript_14184/m.31010 type:complete len:207 (+) Transcript_14184:447-1067(+)